MFARDDYALAAVGLEVFSRRLCEFRRLSAQPRWRQTGDSDRSRHGESESFDLAGPDSQSMIGLGAGRRQRAFGDVQAVHIIRAADQPATINKVARVSDAARTAG